MKYALLWCALAANAYATQPILVRVTPDTIARLKERDPMIRMVKPAQGEAKVERPANLSIIGGSTVLNDGRNWTLVPKGAVIHLPESMKARVDQKPVGHMLPWRDFLTKNRNWIATTEVSFDQAAGHQPIPTDRTGLQARQDRIVVATHQAGPISVRPGSTANSSTSKP